jgi:hypothetical protein
MKSSLGICRSVLLGRAYPEAPVSNLYLWGRRQDLAFQQAEGKSAKRRHHVRLWCSDQVDDQGRPLWLGAATFDRSVGASHYTLQVTHHIEGDVDRERDKLMQDLRRTGRVDDCYRVLLPGAQLRGRNGGGDRYVTDGQLVVGVLAPGKLALARSPVE